jgi:selenocysteine-specific elongation factor
MITIGLAGHIDHGKSALVRVLTQMSPDRLPEEQKRGMTIEAGFSWLTLEDGETISLIDVPGHKDFVKNVLAGLWGIDAALLVVAADDGWMPQTEEHFQFLKFLAVKRAIVVMTKTDIVSDHGWLDVVEEDIRARLYHSNLKDSPIVRVDSLRGMNVDSVLEKIQTLVSGIKRKKDIGKPRLPVDRVFTVRGVGTVVTGTLIDGHLSKDDTLFIPAIRASRRIRSLESFKRSVDRAPAGSRLAVNLVGVEKAELRRGDILFGNRMHAVESHMFDARIELVPFLANPVTSNREVMVYLGTRELAGRIRLLKGKSLGPGEKGFVQFCFKEAVAVRIGDRFIIRRPSPRETIGGGIVLNFPGSRNRFNLEDRTTILQARECLDAKTLVETELWKNKYSKPADLLIASPCSSAEIKESLSYLLREEACIKAGSWVVSRTHWQKQEEKAKRVLSLDYASHPLGMGMDRATFQSQIDLPEDTLSYFISRLRDSGGIALQGSKVALSAHRPSLSLTHEMMVSKIIEAFRKSRTNPPTRNDLLSQIPGCEEIVRHKCLQKVLLNLADGVLFERDHYVAIKKEIIEFLKDHQTISIQQVRSLFGLSRKYILPLLAQLDREGVTLKQGDLRVLAEAT